MKIVHGVLFLLVFLFISCEKHSPPTISFYYWKTTFGLSTLEKEALEYNNVTKLYIRYFDVDLDSNKEPIPVSPIQFTDKPKEVEVVPVVFIKNKVMLKTGLNTEDLAQKVFSYIEGIRKSSHINYDEIQIDCDWSLNSKKNYLNFIEALRLASKKRISATIRLHQIKYYKKTEIPNIEKGTLMYYNMGAIAADSLNSIYNKDIAHQYIKSLKKYPLALNYALPIYSWGIHIRNDRVIGLRSKMTLNTIKKDSNFIALKHPFFKAKNSNYRNGVFYKKGDMIKIEAITKNSLLEMTQDLSSNNSKEIKEIIFYDLDSSNLNNYEKDIFKQIIANF